MKNTDGTRSPDWIFDCNGCKFSWQCGPLCQCVLGYAKEDRKIKSQWHPAKVKGYEKYNDRRGILSIEIKKTKTVKKGDDHAFFKKGENIRFRVGVNNKEGLIVPKTKWMDGVITNATNKWKGQTWGFRVLSVSERE